MDQDLIHMVAASKVPMLKPGEYKLWRMRMEQYIQMIDYSLWEVIENGNAPPIIKVVKGVETIISPTTAKEKAQRRFGGNAATKKTQRNLLKQQHENFTASSSEVLDQTFDRLQKLISQLEIHGESISQEYVNQKFLRSLSPEWNTHTIVWRNKPKIDTLSLDDHYNNLKIYEPEVKGTSSSSTNTLNVTFVSSNSTINTNGAVNTAHGPTNASIQATAVNLTIIDNLSNAVICAFFASQPNSPQLDNEDLQQINPDDLEEMDLRSKPSINDEKKVDEDPRKDSESIDQEKDDNVNSTNNVNAASTIEVNVVGGKTSIELPDDLNMPALEDIIYSDDDEDVGTEADMNNLDAFMPIEEKVYVCQPPRIGDQNSLIEYTCRKGTLWTASSSQSLFEKMMHKKFQMSSIGELIFFLGLQVKQKQDGIFISQDKYVTKILMKFGFTDVKTQDTYGNSNLLLKDEDGEEVDVHLYRSMIGSLMYLTSSRPDIMFVVCAYARYQVNPKVSHLHAVKRIFSLDEVYTQEVVNSLGNGKKIIVAEASVRRGLQLYDEEGTDCLSNDTIFVDSYMGATNQKFNFSKYIFESMVKNLENVSGKFLMYPRFVQVFLEKQLEGMSNHKRIYVTPSHIKKIFRNMRRVGKGFSRRETPLFPKMMVQAQEEMGEGSANPTDPHHTPTIIQPSTSQRQKKQKPRKSKRKDTEVPQPSGPTNNVIDEAVYEEMDDTNTPQSDEDSLKLKELMELYTNLQNRVIDLEKTKTSQAQEITSLKRRVKRLEKKGGSRTHRLKRLYKFINKADKVMLQEPEQGTITTTTDATTVTAASTRPKAKGLVIHEQEQAPTPTVSSQQPSQAKIQDKGKGKMVEPEPVKKFSKKDQIRLDEELDFSIHDELEEED
ncbi:uncharacterized mitochondrial protein-like protein [Tanacetum coccineum]